MAVWSLLPTLLQLGKVGVGAADGGVLFLRSTHIEVGVVCNRTALAPG